MNGSGKTEQKRQTGWTLLVFGVPLLTLFMFRGELEIIYRLVSSFVRPFLFLPPLENQVTRSELFELGLFIPYLALVFIIGYIVLHVIAPFVLPVQTQDEVSWVVKSLWGSIFGSIPSVFRVKEGKFENEPDDERKISDGIVLVDINSAIVLQSRTLRAPRSAGGELEVPGQKSSKRAEKANPFGRVGKPGMVLIRRGEQVRGVVSLRKQIRLNLGVRAYTKDGIEIVTNVLSIFTLGQPPAVIKVAYVGGAKAEHLRVVKIDEKTNQIKAFIDDLDPLDRAEIHRTTQGLWNDPRKVAPLQLEDDVSDYPPYSLDEDRIRNAILARGKSVEDNTPDIWTDLPTMEATRVFRNMISRVEFDSLYLPNELGRYPLEDDFKPGFARVVSYQGVLRYQVISLHNHEDPVVGQIVNQDFRIFPVQELTSSKVLRDRGIKVITASFTDLDPVSEVVQQQRLENWRARWQQRTAITKGDIDREVMRIIGNARADTQREMIEKLSDLLQASSASDEALTWRVFQALEGAAADPKTRQLLPEDIIKMLRDLRSWLLAEDDGHDNDDEE